MTPAPAAAPALINHGRAASQWVNPPCVAQLLSLSSLALTVVGSPLLIYLSSPAGMSSGAKAGIVLTLCSFGCFTTALLQWFVSPYVLRLRRVAGSDEVEVRARTGGAAPTVSYAAPALLAASPSPGGSSSHQVPRHLNASARAAPQAEVLTILAQPRVNRFRVDEIGEAHTQRPLSTFAARGVVYYLHTDSASEAVLESLGLRRAEHEQPQQGKKKRNDDDEDDD